MVSRRQESKDSNHVQWAIAVFAILGAFTIIGAPDRFFVRSQPMMTFQSIDDLKSYLEKKDEFGILNGSDDKSITQIDSISLKLCRAKEICVLSNTIPSGLVWCFKVPRFESGADAIPVRSKGDCATVPVIAQAGELNYLTGKYNKAGDDFDSIPLDRETEVAKPSL